LNKQDAPFDQKEYLVSTLNTWRAYHPQIQSILRALIAYHRQHDHTPAIKQLIQQVEAVISLQSSQAEDMELSINQPVDTTTPSVQIVENAIKPLRSKPDQDLKLYIKNSGLILVWPFIEELFGKQGLLEEGTFLDRIDHNNALHALQYVATEKLSTPDWRLILNKLLVGMPYDEVTFAGYYLRDRQSFATSVLEEQAAKQAIDNPSGKKKKKKLLEPQLPEEVALLKKNTEELLTTVLEEWTSLKELEQYEPYQQGFDIQAFRQYILQRDGMLQYVMNQDQSQGYWHLTITWEMYDADISKTPWSMDSVQLPFMQERIIVSWLP
jgi:hypothetical protein